MTRTWPTEYQGGTTKSSLTLSEGTNSIDDHRHLGETSKFPTVG